MKEIIELNYQSTVQRGLITPSTSIQDFFDKISEEQAELIEAFYDNCNKPDWVEELADVILVCLNFARHYKIDIEGELKKKIDKNFKRVGKA